VHINYVIAIGYYLIAKCNDYQAVLVNLNKLKSMHMKGILFFLILIANINANAQCWSKISAGDYHTLAISINGELWAWGDNYNGELGDGTTINRALPTFVNNSSWQEVSAGLSHSLGLKSDGTLWAWGRNGAGQLGDGKSADNHCR